MALDLKAAFLLSLSKCTLKGIPESNDLDEKERTFLWNPKARLFISLENQAFLQGTIQTKK